MKTITIIINVDLNENNIFYTNDFLHLYCKCFFFQSKESAQSNLNNLYSNHFYKLMARKKPIFRKDKNQSKIKDAFLKIHKKSSKIATIKGHWAYSVKNLPTSCKEVLETGQILPNNYNKKIYPKNHIQFPKQTFYSLVDDCEEALSDNPQMLENYNKGLNQYLSSIDKGLKIKDSILKEKKSAKEKEQMHPNYQLYTEWKKKIKKITNPKTFQLMCKKENEYNPSLYNICLRSKLNSISAISGSLGVLWKDPNGRNNMHEILSLLEIDINSSLKIVEEKIIPDMALVRVKFRNSLKKYFKIKRFKVFSAVSVLN